jgi:hypothetical protein
MKETKVLVLGNDPFINHIDFSKIDPAVITLGVNRIWLKHIPNYFFFNDGPIVTELANNPKTLSDLKANSFCFSSDWLVVKSPTLVPEWTTVYRRPYSTGLPDSVTTAISIFSRNLMANHNITFYIAGVSLKWQEPSHFWKTLPYESLNRHTEKWYRPRFELILKNFTRLKSSGVKMVSVTPNSMLNKVMRYEKIENFYV